MVRGRHRADSSSTVRNVPVLSLVEVVGGGLATTKRGGGEGSMTIFMGGNFD